MGLWIVLTLSGFHCNIITFLLINLTVVSKLRLKLKREIAKKNVQKKCHILIKGPQNTLRYCLLVWFSFIFDSFVASQTIYWNMWYTKSPLWKVIYLLLGWLCSNFCPGSQKSTFWLPNIDEYLTSREYIIFELCSLFSHFFKMKNFE
jgi:hypothetical protein